MRVLLVEDDDGVGDALVEALGAAGHRPTRAKRGADALTGHHHADLVLLDLGLPDLHGLDVLRKLRKVTDMPVLVLTAHGDERSVGTVGDRTGRKRQRDIGEAPRLRLQVPQRQGARAGS